MIATIYKLTDDNGLVYYGSTIRELRERLYGHKHYNNDCFSKFMNSDTMVIESLEQYYFDEDTYNKKFVLQREAYYIRNNKCINKVVPDRTPKESDKEYRLKNKEKIDEKSKEYREKNKEKIAVKDKEYYEKNKEKLNEKIDCECGGKYTYCHKSRHMKTQKHINYIEKTT